MSVTLLFFARARDLAGGVRETSFPLPTSEPAVDAEPTGSDATGGAKKATKAHCTVAQLKRALLAAYPRLSKALPAPAEDGAAGAGGAAPEAGFRSVGTAVIAVNQEYADDDTVVHAGDEVAVIPPVSGG